MSRRRLTATEVDFDVLRQRALLVGTGIPRATPRRPRASRVPKPVPTSSARCWTTAEVDLGRGEPPARAVDRLGAVLVTQRLQRRRRCRRRTRATTGPPRRTVSPSSTREVAAGHGTVTRRRRDRAGARPRRPRTRRCRTTASRRRRAPTPACASVVGAGDRDELDVGALREALVVLEPRPVRA